MKPLPLILSFLPLIAFSLLSRLLPPGYIGVAGLAAALIALIAMATSRPVWPPKILNACSLVLFALIAVLGFTLGKADDRWLATWGGAGVGIVLGLIILALVPVMPFTEQFARRNHAEGLLGLADLQEDQPRAQRRLGPGHLRHRRLPGRGRGHRRAHHPPPARDCCSARPSRS